MISRCLWKPGRDSWRETLAFCKMHYGEAAGPIIGWLTRFHNHCELSGVHFNCFPSSADMNLTQDLAIECYESFQKALSLAENDTVRKRVEKASICAYVALIDSSPWEVRDGALRLTPPKGFEDILGRYEALAARYGVNMATERDTVPAYLARYKPQPVIELENAVWKLVVMPGSNGKVVRWLHKPSGRQLVRGRLMGGRIRGVFEEWMPIGCPKPDGKNPVLDAKVNGNSIELTKRLSHGGVIVRTLWLDEKAPDKVFCKTVCTNKGSKPWTHQLKIHPEFDAATEDFRQLEVVRYLDGKWQGFAPTGLPSGDHLQEPVVAAEDTWHAFYSRAAGFGVRASYNPKQIAERYIWVSPQWRQFNLELIAKTVTLQPGESSSVEYEFDYLDGLPE